LNSGSVASGCSIRPNFSADLVTRYTDCSLVGQLKWSRWNQFPRTTPVD
jgi:hypothetical protein